MRVPLSPDLHALATECAHVARMDLTEWIRTLIRAEAKRLNVKKPKPKATK